MNQKLLILSSLFFLGIFFSNENDITLDSNEVPEEKAREIGEGVSPTDIWFPGAPEDEEIL